MGRSSAGLAHQHGAAESRRPEATQQSREKRISGNTLILEIHTHGLHRYHVIDKPLTRIGRAFDNDIILSEPTVAPYHLEIIRCDEGKIELNNLSSVNPAHFNGVAVKSLVTESIPIDIKLGRIMARIVLPDQTVADTKTLAGNGQSKYLFSHTLWGIIFIALCLLASCADYYLHIFTSFKWDSLAKFVARETALYLATMIFFLSILERLIINRWEIKPLVVVISATYLLFQLMTPVVEELNYVFSSNLAGSMFNILWFAVFIPIVAGLYLIRINHLNRSKGIWLAILFSSPFIVFSGIEAFKIGGFLNDFSASANYHKNLSALNWHFDETLSISSFIEQAKSLKSGEFVD